MKHIIHISILLVLISCKEPTGIKNTQIIKNEPIEESIENKLVKEVRSWDIPNENTKIEILKSNISINDATLISRLKPFLNNKKFKIEETKLIESKFYKNCKDNIILRIEGKGLKKYYVKRTESKPKNYYPDFIMWVYEFENESQAVTAKKKILNAFKSSNGYCNGKEPNYLVLYDNKIIHLTTRAEMFRGYIIDIAEKIKNYS
ncbi:hypothetical protein [Algibacter lectus]|uniref:Lipoprotein n=1 Tax=Algibacter lectus TaxID=221126 RepID=A0A4V3HGE0_9FLAO|nr:hypothetical protein [Algibacter lectus]MWW25730.1 hypothetical protein [Algibacter lectus]TDY61011.1 hypothetical protein DFQ06_3020 [Algibacter lectus]